MHYNFPYPNLPGLEIDERNETKIYEVKAEFQPEDPLRLIEQSLARPIGMERFSRILHPGSKILIIIDDISRPTPVRLILPPLLAELGRAGVQAANIRFLIALGTHRPMTAAEIEQKVGPEIARNYLVLNHEWENPAALHDYGRLDDGTPVILNRQMALADFVIGVGSIAPHPAAGFSGGGKIIAPGVATEAAVGEFHWKSVQFPEREVLGVRDNPMRRIIDAIAAKAGLSAIVNVIADGRQRVVKVVTGASVQAHRLGCEYALGLFGARIDPAWRADIYIADSHPMDQEMWQAVKGMCALDVVAPDGAVVILVTPCPEGVSQMHPEILKYGYVSLAEADRLIREENLSKVAAHNMVQGGRLVRRTTAFLVSPGVGPAEAERLGFRSFATPQSALDAALRLKGDRARIAILRMGGDLCPIVSG
ncbi:nickel-dependent lactate racemase [Hydrogenispora ethanolica]|uniref:Nickel-dependent lactate racemase n=1 Tax=Hydrogenispora ethanolica TaxID=1082276 RepID=A0A4R1S2Q8_HYDET|nr:nickel-dependent lactate racemase [Hydrogenispora ethanolica]TCL73184.1 nickel-dependent lactate racemase [Hydrogenispora ethanolica]